MKRNVKKHIQQLEDIKRAIFATYCSIIRNCNLPDDFFKRLNRHCLQYKKQPVPFESKMFEITMMKDEKVPYDGLLKLMAEYIVLEDTITNIRETGVIIGENITTEPGYNEFVAKRKKTDDIIIQQMKQRIYGN